MKWYWYIVILLSYHFLANFYNWCWIKHFQINYPNWLATKKGNTICEKIPKIKKLLKHANIEEPYFSVLENAGYGQLFEGKGNVIDNLATCRKDIIGPAINVLAQTSGVYKHRFLGTFNPFYWISIIIYLPEKVLLFFGVKPDKTIIKLFQAIYWFLGLLATIITLIKSNIFASVIEWLKQL